MNHNQQELFNIHQAGNLAIFEPRPAAGNTQAASSPLLPPAPVVGRIAFGPSEPSEPLPPFKRDSETSRQAAIKKYDRHNGRNQREDIYEYVASLGQDGATREEIANHFNMKIQTVCPRVKELLGESKGYAVARIMRRDQGRKTESGMNADVLVAIRN